MGEGRNCLRRIARNGWIEIEDVESLVVGGRVRQYVSQENSVWVSKGLIMGVLEPWPLKGSR